MKAKTTVYTFNVYYNADIVFQELYPNCYKLLYLFIYLLTIFPLTVACVECFFSKLKLVKTRLRNQLSPTTLESLIRILTESPKEGSSDSQFHRQAKEKQSKNENEFLFLFYFWT